MSKDAPKDNKPVSSTWSAYYSEDMASLNLRIAIAKLKSTKLSIACYILALPAFGALGISNILQNNWFAIVDFSMVCLMATYAYLAYKDVKKYKEQITDAIATITGQNDKAKTE